jgi:hypothetical protein
MSLETINSLDHKLVINICHSLQDRDAKALGITSKKMLGIIKRELENRDKQQEQLLSFYTITRKFNIQTLKETDLFLLGELHHHPQCLSSQIAFIAFLASRGPVILIQEGWPSMSVLKETDSWLVDIKSTASPIFKENVYAIGWDDQKELQELETAIDLEYKELNRQLDMYRDYVLQKTYECFSYEVLPQERRLSREEISNSFPNLAPWECFSTLMETIISIGHANIDRFPPETYNNFLHIEQVFQNLENSFYNIKERRQILITDAVKKTFPIRTKSMCNTLGKIDRLRSSDPNMRNAKAVLIGGIRHLELGEADINQEPEWDLTPLYEQLSHARAAILMPLTAMAAHKARIAQLTAEIEKEDST